VPGRHLREILFSVKPGVGCSGRDHVVLSARPALMSSGAVTLILLSYLSNVVRHRRGAHPSSNAAGGREP
jgi:hypothetical protein